MIEGLVTQSKLKVKISQLAECIELHPFGDVHWDTDACEHKRWEADLADMKEAVKRNPHTYFLGMGDYLDFMAYGERRKVKASGMHDSTMRKLHQSARADLRAFYKTIEFMKGRTIGLIGGNHDWEFEDGKTGTEVLCEWLGCQYLGWLNYTSIVIDYHGAGFSADVVSCHGRAGGKLLGTSINQVCDLKQVFPGADILCMGHDHQRGGLPSSSLFAVHDHQHDALILKEKTQWACRTGSYLRGYMVGDGTYVSRKLCRPCSLGKIAIRIYVDRCEAGGKKDMKLKIKVEA